MSYPSYGMTIENLVKVAFGDSCMNGWWDDPNVNLAEKLALIHSEVSEALEDLRKENRGIPLNEMDFDTRYEPSKPIGFASEMADIVIRVADLCGYLSIDLEQAIKRKLAYNRTRGHKHGGKKF